MLSFVHSDASIVLHSRARLVVRNAAFYTPFRGWHDLAGIPSWERPPSITGIRCLDDGGTVVIDHLICEGLKHCVVNHASHVTITNSLFLENYEAIHDDGASGNYLEVKRSIFFRNDRGTGFPDCSRCSVESSLFLQNNIAMASGDANVVHSTFVQNGQAIACESYLWSCDNLRLNDVLFYSNDIAVVQADRVIMDYTRAKGVLQNVTFLDNRIGMKVLGKVEVMNRINFLGLGYHFHYTGTELFNLHVASTFWNTTSLDEVETHIYDALDGSGAGVVQIFGAESLPHVPFQHGMYQEDLCAGQCNQHWFNANWSSLISGGAGTFGFFDPERSLNSGQVLREALLTGHETPSNMSLSSYMQDVAGLLEAVGAFQTVGVSTSTVTAIPTQTVTTSSSAIKVPVEQILGGTLFSFSLTCSIRSKRREINIRLQICSAYCCIDQNNSLRTNARTDFMISAKHTKLGTLTCQTQDNSANGRCWLGS